MFSIIRKKIKCYLLKTWSDILHDDPHAAPRGPVHLFTLLAVVVSERILQLFKQELHLHLDKLMMCNNLGK